MKRKITSLLVLFSLATQAQISNTLIASYNFDGNIADQSGNNWNGTPVGGNSNYVADRMGNASKALSLDGIDDKVLFGNLPLHGNFSISLWLNASANAVVATPQSIISKRPACTVGNFIDVRGLSTSYPNSVNIEALNGSSISGSGAGADINKNEWMHVVYVFDSLSRKTKIYLDGKMSTERPWDANFKTVYNTASFGIGNSPCANPTYKGLMDDMKIYYGSLNQTAINTLYSEQGYCKQNGGTITLSGNKVLDNSANGTYIGKIIKSKLTDVWILPADSADNQTFTFRNDSLFTNNLTKNNSVALFVLNTCEKKVQKFNILKGNIDIFLISKYSFSNNLNDESGNGWNGTASVTVNYVNDASNNPNSAIPLTRAGNIYSLGDQPWDDANLTISFWMKPTSTSTNSILFSKRSVCGVSNFIDVRYNVDGTIAAEILSSNNGTAHISSTLNTLLPVGNWYHVVFVLDKINKKSLIYVNGVLAQTSNWLNFTGLDNNAQFVLGNSPCSVNGYKSFDGTLDQISVYGLPLKQNDVTNLYNSYSVVTNISNLNSIVNKAIFPNPTNEFIFVNEYSEIFDMLGNKVGEGAEKINLSNLSNGIYLVKSASQIVKIVKN